MCWFTEALGRHLPAWRLGGLAIVLVHCVAGREVWPSRGFGGLAIVLVHRASGSAAPSFRGHGRGLGV